MRTIIIQETTGITCNESTEGEHIEMKIKRALENDEPIEDSSELIFTERQDGVQHDYDVRSDKWDMAIEAIGQKNKSALAQRQEALNKKAEANKKDGDNPVQ